jgi:hypothetical protein
MKQFRQAICKEKNNMRWMVLAASVALASAAHAQGLDTRARDSITTRDADWQEWLKANLNNPSHQWNTTSTLDTDYETEFLRVPGGWLIKHRYSTKAADDKAPQFGETMAFVPGR